MTALAKTGARGAGPKEPFVPTERWLAELDRQMAESTFFDAMWRYAERRGRMLMPFGGVDPEAYGTDLVQSIMRDTLAGLIRWDPKRVDLRKHVRDAIKSRSRHDYKRASKRPHLSIDDETRDNPLDEISARQLENEPERAERVRCIGDVIAAIRDDAADDPEVQLMIEAFERGAHSRDDVMSLVALTENEYDAARKRLDRLIENLPNQLIRSALRSR